MNKKFKHMPKRQAPVDSLSVDAIFDRTGETALFEETALPEEVVLPEETALPKETTLPQETAPPEEAALPELTGQPVPAELNFAPESVEGSGPVGEAVPSTPSSEPTAPDAAIAFTRSATSDGKSSEPIASNSARASRRLKGLNKGGASNTGLPSNPEPTPAAEPPLLTADEELREAGVRQTVIIGAQYLEQMRDTVHERRARGEYQYTQRQLLEEALDAFFAEAPPAPPRPAYVRKREEEQRTRIRRGRQQGTNG